MKTTFVTTTPEKMVPCILFKPEFEDRKFQEMHKVIYDLFVLAGKPFDGEGAEGRSWICFGNFYGGPKFQYQPHDFDMEGTPWQVPCWAIQIALHIKGLANDAENIGYERGVDHGLASGKGFVKQLASGDMSLADFDDADFRDERRLGRKEW